jgi:hypothetical protein
LRLFRFHFFELVVIWWVTHRLLTLVVPWKVLDVFSSISAYLGQKNTSSAFDQCFSRELRTSHNSRDGSEVAQQFKAMLQTEHIFMTVLAGLTEMDHRVAALDAGGVHCFIKPVKPDEVMTRMTRMTRHF